MQRSTFWNNKRDEEVEEKGRMACLHTEWNDVIAGRYTPSHLGCLPTEENIHENLYKYIQVYQDQLCENVSPE